MIHGPKCALLACKGLNDLQCRRERLAPNRPISHMDHFTPSSNLNIIKPLNCRPTTEASFYFG